MSSNVPEGPITEWMIGSEDNVGVVEQQDVQFKPMSASDTEDVKVGESLADDEDTVDEGNDQEEQLPLMTTRSRVLKRPSTFSMTPALKPQTTIEIDHLASTIFKIPFLLKSTFSFNRIKSLFTPQ